MTGRYTEPRLGMAGGAVTVTVTHRCGHGMRWSFFGNVRQRRQLAALARCARCEGEAPFDCDIVWPATGICHVHAGRCPDSAHDAFLHNLGARTQDPPV